jgi:xanthine dehydrogenase accessory factor
VEHAFHPDPGVEAKLLELLKAGERVALAVVIETEGSTPQVPGAAALFTRQGLAAGTVGGGTAEARAQKAADRALRTGRSSVLSFHLAGELNLDADGVCGGSMRLLIDADPGRDRSVFAAVLKALESRRPGVLAVAIRRAPAGGKIAVRRSWLPAALPASRLKAAGLAGFRGEAAACLAEKRPRLAAAGRGWIYLEPRLPAPRLLIAGAGHVGRAVSRLGAFLGFAVQVFDDRSEFAAPARFPEAERIIVGDPAVELGRASVDGGTFVVIVTRGHRHDAAALRACIRRPAAYIGMIGSARKVGLLRDEFLARGWASAAEWARVHTPIGLPIGSRTVEEIAVSIAAELVAVKNKGAAAESATPPRASLR